MTLILRMNADERASKTIRLKSNRSALSACQINRKHMTKLLHKDLTEIIIGVFYDVYNTLGYGFLEKVYETAMAIELDERGVYFDDQYPIDVFYKSHKVGKYFADLIVENSVIIELKANEYIRKDDEYQLLNYLKATNIEVGLLLNFGKKPEFKRIAFSNVRKPDINPKK
jgi:GxxExxY protein